MTLFYPSHICDVGWIPFNFILGDWSINVEYYNNSMNWDIILFVGLDFLKYV